MPERILGLDVGSTSARALVIYLSSRVHGRALTRLESTHPGPGRVEQDPREVWGRVEGILVEALSVTGHQASGLAAVGIGG